MKDLYGDDIGVNIELRGFGGVDGTRRRARHPWPAETRVSAGNGVVFVRGGEAYETLFMKLYPPCAPFIRGEGETPAGCEDTCRAHYQKALRCPDTARGEHEWEARDYRNGAGFCAHCGTFKSNALTGERLGQLCHQCGSGRPGRGTTAGSAERTIRSSRADRGSRTSSTRSRRSREARGRHPDQESG